jgi:hypothetical protein
VKEIKYTFPTTKILSQLKKESTQKRPSYKTINENTSAPLAHQSHTAAESRVTSCCEKKEKSTFPENMNDQSCVKSIDRTKYPTRKNKKKLQSCYSHIRE